MRCSSSRPPARPSRRLSCRTAPRPGRFIHAGRKLQPPQLAELVAEWKRRDERDRDKLERMEAYARSALCRWRVLREYFSEDTEERCGVCDNCRKGLAERAEVGEARVRPE